MKKIVLLIILFLPVFALMLSFGVFTMHDFHLFRQYEFSRCFAEGIFPCRWSANSAMGYGEPLFVFYGQMPYWLGQVFHLTGLSIINSVKAVYIFSLIMSGVTSYLLVSRYWGKLSGLLSAVLYVYAPYRAVDVWVRGALPEALSFIIFPLLFLFLNQYLSSRRSMPLLYFSISFAALLITHNLSAFMITPFLGLFYLYRLFRERLYFSILPLLFSGIITIIFAAFYLLPVITESSLTTVTATTQSYYNFQLHFTSLKQLLFSRFWGYGGSVWGINDGMSFSLGQIHWLLLISSAILLILTRKQVIPYRNYTIVFILLCLFAVFLTHGKSEFIWKLVPGLPFVQFPWRFLSPATFFISLVPAIIPVLLKSHRTVITALLIPIIIGTNFSFFRPDIWRSIGDSVQFSGLLWDEQRSSALQDYWPKTAPILPAAFAPDFANFTVGQGRTISFLKNSSSASYYLEVFSEHAWIDLPIVYFPGWKLMVNGQLENAVLNQSNGLIAVGLTRGIHRLDLKFCDTPVRTLGNLISLFGLVFIPAGFLIYEHRFKNKTA